MHRKRDSRSFPIFAAASLALALGACGGSGGSTDTDPQPRAKATLTIASRTPSAGQKDASVTTTVSANFSAALDASTATDSVFTLTANGASVAGSVSTSNGGKTLQFTPNAALASATTYAVHVGKGLKGQEGEELADEVSWTFTTSAASPVFHPPKLDGTKPAANETGVALDSEIEVRFTGDIRADSVTKESVQLHGPGGRVDADVEYAAKKAKVRPQRSLQPGSTYTLKLSDAIANDGDQKLTPTEVKFFTIESPVVEKHDPANGESNVRPDRVVVVTFSRKMDESSIDEDTFAVRSGSNVEGTREIREEDGKTVVYFRAKDEYEAGQTYEVRIEGATDEAGVPMTKKTFSFDIAPELRITKTTPRGTIAGLRPTIRVEFDQDIDAASVTSTNFKLKEGSNTISGTLQHGTNWVTLEPSTALMPGTKYRMHVHREVRSKLGVRLGNYESFDFETQGREWQIHEQVGAADEGYAQPELAYSENGDGIAVWLDSPGFQTQPFAATFTGGRWQTRTPLETLTSGFGEEPQIAIARNGFAIAIWRWGNRSNSHVRYRTYDPRKGWDPQAQDLAFTSRDVRHRNPRLAMSPDGHATAVWVKNDQANDRYSLEYRRYIPGTGWAAAGTILASQDSQLLDLQLVQEDSGRASVVFLKKDGDPYRVHAATGARGARWSAVRPIDDPRLTQRNREKPRIAAKAGVLLVVWIQNTQVATNWRDRLWANRCDLSSMRWDTPTIADSATDKNSDDPAVAMNDDGEAVIIWRQVRGTGAALWDMGFQQFDARRGLGLSSRPQLDGKFDRGAAGNSYPQDFQLGIDGNGNAMVVYRSDANSRFDVYHRTLNGSGFGTEEAIETHQLAANTPRFEMLPDGRALAIWHAYENRTGFLVGNHYE